MAENKLDVVSKLTDATTYVGTITTELEKIGKLNISKQLVGSKATEISTLPYIRYEGYWVLAVGKTTFRLDVTQADNITLSQIAECKVQFEGYLGSKWKTAYEGIKSGKILAENINQRFIIWDMGTTLADLIADLQKFIGAL